jgi:hypothetical protein
MPMCGTLLLESSLDLRGFNLTFNSSPVAREPSERTDPRGQGRWTPPASGPACIHSLHSAFFVELPLLLRLAISLSPQMRALVPIVISACRCNPIGKLQ